MSKRQRRKKKRNRRKKTTSTRTGVRFSVAMTKLELAKGHDGFLRGAPEPVVMLGSYLLAAAGPRLLGRTIYRVNVPDKFPCTVLPHDAEVLSAYYHAPGSAALLTIALALEEDDGSGVGRLFADLEAVGHLALWPQYLDIPAPLELAELLPVHDAWLVPHKVSVMHGNEHLSERCLGDEWIGACAFITPTDRRRTERVRTHFVSLDERNDWTAELVVGV